MEEMYEDQVDLGLKMSRVPPKAKLLFLKLSRDEFADDYGMTLKFLLDKFLEYNMLIGPLNALVSSHEMRLRRIEEKESEMIQKPVGKQIKSADGTIIYEGDEMKDERKRNYGKAQA